MKDELNPATILGMETRIEQLEYTLARTTELLRALAEHLAYHRQFHDLDTADFAQECTHVLS